jgi:hypothetical protein
MRRVSEQEDSKALSLLNAGAIAAAGKAETDKKLQQLHEQVSMLQYALGNVFKALTDFPNVKAQIDQLDYRTLGIARAIGELKLCDDFSALVEKHAKQARIDAFDELSNKDDEQRKLGIADYEALTDQHWVIISSECKEDADQGIFRSKMAVGGEELAEIKESFLGKTVGETFEVKIQGKDHLVTILGIRKHLGASDASTKE